MPTTFNQVWWDDTENRTSDHGHCSHLAGSISRHRKGRRGRRRHWCLLPDTEWVSHKPDGTGSNPCRLAGSSDESWIGGGKDGNGNQTDFTGRSTNFNNANMAIKCTFNSVNSSKLKEMSRTPSVYDSSGSGAVETNDGFKSQWEQLVFGITTEAGNNTGFCEHVNNINKQVHNDGRTCYDVLTDAVTKKARGIQWCDSNPTDSVCACINISKGVRHCLNNPTHPGCDTLVAEYNKFPGNAQTEFDTRNFSPKCFAPDVCAQSGQYQPMQGADVCSQTIAVCQQDLNMYGDVASGALVEIDQSMRCEAKTEKAPSAGSGDTGGGGGGGGGGIFDKRVATGLEPIIFMIVFNFEMIIFLLLEVVFVLCFLHLVTPLLV